VVDIPVDIAGGDVFATEDVEEYKNWSPAQVYLSSIIIFQTN
jgi:hypothetical protein